MDASPRVHERCRDRSAAPAATRSMATPSHNAAQSLDPTFITAITSSGWAAARPSNLLMDAKDLFEGPRVRCRRPPSDY